MQKHKFSYFKLLFALLITFLLSNFVFLSSLAAQHVDELYSPLTLAQGTSPVTMESPVGDVLNPAASALSQRITLDLNYIGLAGLGLESGYGQAANLGITLPSKFGVFNGSAHFVSSPFPGGNLGNIGALNLSFAKDLFSTFLIGVGLNGIIGTENGVGFDVGFIHLADNFLMFKDFRWGMTMRNMGFGYAPATDNNYLFPQSFTPALGAYGKLIKNDTFSVALLGDVAVPFTSNFNVQLHVGGEFVYKDFLSLYASCNLDMLELADTTAARIPLTLGGAIKFNLTGSKNDIKFMDLSERGWDKSEIKINLAATPLQNGVWGFGGGLNIPLGVIDKQPPKVNMDIADEVYISPNNDGVQDDFVLPLQIKDERYIKGYKLEITDAAGKPVKQIVNKDERPENVSVKNVIDRLLYVKKGIQVPESLRWDGKSDTGAVVPDGEYSYTLECWDDNGNTGKTPARKIVVDNQPPAATVKADYLVFSPNGDGNKDVLTIKQDGSQEIRWDGQVKDAKDNLVAEFSWEGKPAPFEWNGKNKDGILVPDGVYSYTLSSRDKAGNSASFPINNIIISTEATPININIDNSYISPNKDGVDDTIHMKFDIPVTRNIEKWNLKILDKDEKTVRQISGSAQVPEAIDFDGMDDSGKVLKEGTYKGVLNVLYVNGNNPSATTPEFIVDLTPPQAKITADYSIFSPNNDGNKDSVTIYQETSLEVSWTGEIKDEENNTVKRFLWKGVADNKVEWQGKGDDGALLPDGVYSYFITATDKAGNKGESNHLTFRIETKETPVFVTTDANYFSPNADGVNETINIIPHLSIASDIDQYSLTIKDAQKQAVKTFKGKGKVPETFKWDGKDDKDKRVADGAYVAELNILYTNGNNPKANTNQFTIDTQYPAADISTEYTLFSPDGDGERDTIIVNQKTSSEDLWEGTVLNSQGTVIQSRYWKGEAGVFTWDGKDEHGNKLPNGSYTYQLACTDQAGNKTVKVIKGLEMDTTPTPVFLTVDGDGFSPNKDGVLDTIAFQLMVNNKKGIKAWKLEMVNDQAGVQKTFKGTSDVPDKIVWDGTKDASNAQDKPASLASEGTYYGRLTVEYLKGNKPVEKTKTFSLDVTPPEVAFNMTPKPFSPDNDGIEDELFITMKVKDQNPISEWKLEILDPIQHHFTSFGGKGVPSEKIIWDGVSDKGVLVEAAEDYPYELTISDVLGNKTVLKDIIPIDVLVMRFGDKLKIRISSITFAAGETDYVNVEADRAAKNQRTLQRLAQIFNKYSAYNIRIEGHALNIYYNDAAKSAIEEKSLLPLSIERAKVIKEGLVKLGIASDRITTEGYGGGQPVVPASDENNRWKNRRVEFILIKK